MEERMIEVATSDKGKSRSRYLKFLGGTFMSEGMKIADGDYLIEEVILRFKDGQLHGGTDVNGGARAAVEFPDTHHEYWEGGVLHRADGPAVITDWGNWEEWWSRGELVKITAVGEGNCGLLEARG
jgi:hypothetical protein